MKGRKMEAKAPMRTFGDQRLSPGMYSLGGDTLNSLKFRLDWGDFDEECNLNEALSRLGGARLRELDFMEVRNSDRDTYTVGKDEVKVEGHRHHVRILRELVELASKGVRPCDATWFFYYGDDERQMFFVLYGGRIVDECYSFLNVFPLVLGGGGGDETTDITLHGYPDREEALECYWYRKFYTETLGGQIMVLNPHKPCLYHYTRKTTKRTKDPTPELLASISCVVIPILAAIAFPPLRVYMEFAAIVLFVPWWAIACWQIYRESHNFKRRPSSGISR